MTTPIPGPGPATPSSVGPVQTPGSVPWSAELGRTGLKRYAYDRVFLDGEEWLPQLKGRFGARVFREIADSEPAVSSALLLLDLMFRKAEWRWEAASDKPRDKALAEFLEECFDDLGTSGQTWAETLSEMTSMLVFGWAWHEIVFKPRNGRNWTNRRRSSKYRDGKIGLAALSPRAQDTLNGWTYDRWHNLTGMRQLAPPDYRDQVLWRVKACHLRHRARNDSPEGYSLLRPTFVTWWFAKRFRELEGIAIERDGAGLPVIYAPANYFGDGASDDEKRFLRLLEDLAQNIRRDSKEGVVFPRAYDENNNLLYEIQLLASGGTRALNIQQTIERLENRMAMMLLTQFMLLGSGATGSWALSSDQTSLFTEASTSFLRSIADEINASVVPLLAKVNGINEQWDLPTLVPEPLSKRNLTELATYLSNLTAAGAKVFPDEGLLDWLFDIADLPERTHETRQRAQLMQAAEDEQMLMGGIGAIDQATPDDPAEEMTAPEPGDPEWADPLDPEAGDPSASGGPGGGGPSGPGAAGGKGQGKGGAGAQVQVTVNTGPGASARTRGASTGSRKR